MALKKMNYANMADGCGWESSKFYIEMRNECCKYEQTRLRDAPRCNIQDCTNIWTIFDWGNRWDVLAVQTPESEGLSKSILPLVSAVMVEFQVKCVFLMNLIKYAYFLYIYWFEQVLIFFHHERVVKFSGRVDHIRADSLWTRFHGVG